MTWKGLQWVGVVLAVTLLVWQATEARIRRWEAEHQSALLRTADSATKATDAKWAALAPRVDTIVRTLPQIVRQTVSLTRWDTLPPDTVIQVHTDTLRLAQERIDTLAAACLRCAQALAQTRDLMTDGFAWRDTTITGLRVSLRQATKPRVGFKTGLVLGAAGVLLLRR